MMMTQPCAVEDMLVTVITAHTVIFIVGAAAECMSGPLALVPICVAVGCFIYVCYFFHLIHTFARGKLHLPSEVQYHTALVLSEQLSSLCGFCFQLYGFCHLSFQ